MDLLECDHSKYEAVCCVALAGGLAGFSQELLSHYTVLWEEVGCKRSLHAKIPSPNVRSLVTSSCPIAISFIAFEYGRDTISQNDDQML